MTIVAIVLPIVIWLVFGYFAVRMNVLERRANNERFSSWREEEEETKYISQMFLFGLITWIGCMIGSIAPSEYRIRRRAHFIPKLPKTNLGPGKELKLKWFNLD